MCERCHHRGYYTRDDAKAVRKRHHGAKGMAVFACPHTNGMFHIGHRPAALSAGIIDRAVLREQAQQLDNHPDDVVDYLDFSGSSLDRGRTGVH